jgi:hypothetical protein
MLIPDYFSFKNRDVMDFDKALQIFDWNYSKPELTVNFSSCQKANYQTMALVILYLSKMHSQGIRVDFHKGSDRHGAYSMWRKMGGPQLFHVLFDEKSNFRTDQYKPLYAIRSGKDFKLALEKVETYTRNFNQAYEKTIRYIISELLYNTIEHGISYFNKGMSSVQMPSIIQFSYYEKVNSLQFIIADLGVGIKRHLEYAYPPFENDDAAIMYSLRPNVSGTFGVKKNYSSAINNAGMGLFLSSSIARRLHADMYVVSGNGLVHISPSDVTSKTLINNWPGTFVLVSIKLSRILDFDFDSVLSSFRESARKEITANDEHEEKNQFYLSIFNYFGSFAEDKDMAKKIRDEKIIPAMRENKKLLLDFDNVKQAPHSFLNALLATSIAELGMQSYKRIKYINETKEIKNTLEYIFDQNT